MQQKENVVVKNQVILNSIQDLQRLPWPFINNLRGRFQIKFGMTTLFNNGGFTLIELLVVVLIIGILAAVAVPQYQKAVAKSRAVQLLEIATSVSKAEEIYYLENGTYTTNINDLSISYSVPAAVTILLQKSPSSVRVKDSRLSDIFLMFGYQQQVDSWWSGRRTCYASKDSTVTNQLCQYITNNSIPMDNGNYFIYNFK